MPSSQTKVTSTKSLSFLSAPNAKFKFSWKSFHLRQSFSELCIFFLVLTSTVKEECLQDFETSLRLFACFTTCANYQIKAMSLFMVMSMLKYVNYVGRGHHSGGGQQHQHGQQSGRQHQDGQQQQSGGQHQSRVGYHGGQQHQGGGRHCSGADFHGG